MGAFKSKLAGLLLLCVLVDPVVGAYTWLHYQKAAVKNQAKERIAAGIDRNDLVVLIFAKEDVQTELKWEHPGEFEYNDQMYDVVETLTLGNTVYYWCWPDDEETKLNRQLKELTARTFGKGPKIRENCEGLISFSKSLYCPAFFNWNGTFLESLHKPFCFCLDRFSSIAIQPPIPPPEFV